MNALQTADRTQPAELEAKTHEAVTRGGYGASGDVLAGVTLARHGADLFQTYRVTVEKDLAPGTLKELLTPYGGPDHSRCSLSACASSVVTRTQLRRLPD